MPTISVLFLSTIYNHALCGPTSHKDVGLLDKSFKEEIRNTLAGRTLPLPAAATSTTKLDGVYMTCYQHRNMTGPSACPCGMYGSVFFCTVQSQ